MKILKCMTCGGIVVVIKEGASVACCGKNMVELKANTVDAAVEKHVPVIQESDGIVTVTCGEVIHPMEENHFIEFMILETSNGIKIEYLKPGDEPVCKFSILKDEKVINAYAYCNLHGLWKNN